jgi:hypothetical protein
LEQALGGNGNRARTIVKTYRIDVKRLERGTGVRPVNGGLEDRCLSVWLATQNVVGGRRIELLPFHYQWKALTN